MRICLISREFPPDTAWGGIATFTYHLAHGLLEIGHDVEVVTLTGHYSDKKPNKESVENGLRISQVMPHPVLGLKPGLEGCVPATSTVISTASALWETFLSRHNHKPFDIVDSPELLADSFFAAVSRVCPLLIRLYTPHSKLLAERFQNLSPNFDNVLVTVLERMAMLSADVITSPSKDLADFVSKDLRVPIDDIHIICNPIDTNVFCPEGPKALPDLNGKLVVLFVGRLEDRKGVDYLIRTVPAVVKECAKAHFVLIGPDTNTGKGNTSVRQALETFLTEADCIDKVSFLPRVPLAELPNYYRSAAVCVVPSTYDNSPYTCLEAMSCGKPVVGTMAGGTPEYLGEAGLVVPPKDSELLSQAISKLLASDAERERLGQLARVRVLEEFARAEIAKRTAELYQLAIDRFKAKTILDQSLIYRRPPQILLGEATSYADAFEKAMVNLLYFNSLGYRIKRWFRQATTSPDTVGKKLLSKIK